MRVVLHIGRLVVHDAMGFDRHAFADALAAEVTSRLPAGASPVELAARFDSCPRHDAGASAVGGRTSPQMAHHVARRLLP
jgi:hypothetical protein